MITVEELFFAADKISAIKFHACMTISHETFEEIPLKVICNKPVKYFEVVNEQPVAKFTAVYSKIVNQNELREVVYQCERMDIHEHKNY